MDLKSDTVEECDVSTVGAEWDVVSVADADVDMVSVRVASGPEIVEVREKLLAVALAYAELDLVCEAATFLVTVFI